MCFLTSEKSLHCLAIPFSPLAVGLIVSAFQLDGAVPGKKTQKNYKGQESVSSGKTSAIRQIWSNHSLDLADAGGPLGLNRACH